MDKGELSVGDVVQLDPAAHLQSKLGFFAGCFMIVTEVKPWGAQGYISMPGERGESPGAAYYRAKWAEMHLVGKAEWVQQQP